MRLADSSDCPLSSPRESVPSRVVKGVKGSTRKIPTLGLQEAGGGEDIRIESRRSVTSRARHSGDFSFTSLNRSALAMTLTEESDIAAAAMIGDSSMPVTG